MPSSLLYIRHCAVLGAVLPVSSNGPNRRSLHPAAHRSVVLKTPTSGLSTNVAMVAVEHVNSILPETARSSLAAAISNQLGQIMLFDVLRSLSQSDSSFSDGVNSATDATSSKGFEKAS